MYLIPLMFWWDHSHSEACFPPLPSTVSFGPDDWAPSVSTTLGDNTLASEESIRSSPAAWCSGERGRLQPSSCASEWPCLWVIPPSELLLTACSQGEQLSFPVWLLLLWSWTACCYQAWGTACLFPSNKKKKKKKEKRSENQFLIKQICRGCIKRCSTFALAQLSVWCDLEDATHCLTNSVRSCWGRCCFCLTPWLIVGSSLPSLPNVEKQWLGDTQIRMQINRTACVPMCVHPSDCQGPGVPVFESRGRNRKSK